jgi:hypothetical protein
MITTTLERCRRVRRRWLLAAFLLLLLFTTLSVVWSPLSWTTGLLIMLISVFWICLLKVTRGFGFEDGWVARGRQK